MNCATKRHQHMHQIPLSPNHHDSSPNPMTSTYFSEVSAECVHSDECALAPRLERLAFLTPSIYSPQNDSPICILTVNRPLANGAAECRHLPMVLSTGSGTSSFTCSTRFIAYTRTKNGVVSQIPFLSGISSSIPTIF